MKITKQSIIPCQNNENHAITRIPCQNYENHEKNVIPCNENHEILIIPRNKNENHYNFIKLLNFSKFCLYFSVTLGYNHLINLGVNRQLSI